MTIDLDDLEAKARAATQGQWDIREKLGEDEAWCDWHSVGPFDLTGGTANADDLFIHAAQPSVVLELIARVRELEEALRDAQNELFEAADKFNVIHHNHPGSAADLGIGKYQAEDKAFCAELSDRMMAAADRARTALGGSNG